ncbi:EmrB/QacA subfamily drug resistance transporter [Asanoa ferruginea]|uniref:EmrB/QacA subfamily drug resistance transporter n=1 Tax=Asanoa ferruginea TaxID=53367 RepID=A0A3D9ZUI3_9ACTN|nr:DHA2 family efflux MFS transporter permease subunit [Asanoa ferruginea]REG00285.1 EmrB/QacA subfamily drug resistance transporter [Asanoa ferruginea]GIF52128.1 multidrug resistance protein B [Asanoa ferruginea]
MTTQAADAAGSDKLDSGVLKVAGVVVLGAIMSILDITVVSVALPTFQRDFNATYATVAWTMTAYTLALATVIPITGWAADRFGTKRLYLLSLTLFVGGSVLCSVAWDIGPLIVFRALQGLGGGMLMPLGMTIMTRAAGPDRVGRVMAVLGVPMLLGPIGGPILGGWLIEAAGWHWIFLINLPIGVIAFVLSLRILPKDKPQPSESFDFLGMLLLSPGLALFLYGVSSVPGEGTVAAGKVLIPALIGLALLVSFVLHALRKEHALIDLGLFKNRNLTISTTTLSLFTVAFMGAMLLLPSYFLQVRGETTLHAGLLIAPQGLGAMLTMPMAGRLTDRIGPGKLVLPGIVLIALGMSAFTQVTADSSYVLLLGALFVSGLGMGMTMMPIMSAALASLTHQQVARGSTMMNIIQQTAGSIGTAVMSVILTNQVLNSPEATAYSAVTQGQVPASQVAPAVLDQGQSSLADAFGHTYTIAVVLLALCLIPAFFLPRKRIEKAPDATDEALPVAVGMH